MKIMGTIPMNHLARLPMLCASGNILGMNVYSLPW